MPPVIQPNSLRHLGVLAGDTKNELTQLVSRQGLEGPEEGAPGRPGAPGPTGPEGPPAKSFVFTEGAPSAFWTITHKLKRFPSVMVQDSANDRSEEHTSE